MELKNLHMRHNRPEFRQACWYGDAPATMRVSNPAWEDDYLFCDKHTKRFLRGRSFAAPFKNEREDDTEASLWE